MAWENITLNYIAFPLLGGCEFNVQCSLKTVSELICKCKCMGLYTLNSVFSLQNLCICNFKVACEH